MESDAEVKIKWSPVFARIDFEKEMTAENACAVVDSWGDRVGMAWFGLHDLAVALREGLAEQAAAHDRRVSELLEANNAEVARRRQGDFALEDRNKAYDRELQRRQAAQAYLVKVLGVIQGTEAESMSMRPCFDGTLGDFIRAKVG